jgi:hypothetical protein
LSLKLETIYNYVEGSGKFKNLALEKITFKKFNDNIIKYLGLDRFCIG